jgi:hypothetical protein
MSGVLVLVQPDRKSGDIGCGVQPVGTSDPGVVGLVLTATVVGVAGA